MSVAVGEPSVPPGPRIGRGIVLTLLGLGAFEAVAAAIRAATPWPEEYGLRAKHEWLRAHRDEFDVLFVGTSRTFRGIDPRIVDAELARLGVAGPSGPLRSFNFGIGGMLRFESDFVVDALLAEAPQRLRVVVVEGDPWEPTTDFLRNTWSSRTVYWHDVERTRLAVHSAFLLERPWLDRAGVAWTHLQQFGMKLHNLGQGTRVVSSFLGTSRDPFQRSLTPEQIGVAAGYQPYEDFTAPGPTTWQQSIAANPAYADWIRERVRAQNSAEPRLDLYNRAAVAAQRKRIETHGSQFFVLLTPGDTGGSEERALAQRGESGHLLDFNRPDLDAAYWAPEARIDDLHLSRTGAERLSRAVAQELARALSAER
jgi:hypothetical protein